MSTVRLWIREDGREPKPVGLDVTAPPGRGVMVDVVASSSDEARRIYAMSCQQQDEDADSDHSVAIRRAMKRVSEVTNA